MSSSFEHIADWVLAAIGGLVAWLASQWAKLRGELRDLEREVAKAQTRGEVLEARLDSMPETLREIRDAVTGLRGDISARLEALHARIDGKADRE